MEEIEIFSCDEKYNIITKLSFILVFLYYIIYGFQKNRFFEKVRIQKSISPKLIQAQIQFDKKDYTKALNIISNSFKNQTNDLEMLSFRASVYYHLSDYYKSLKDCQQYINLTKIEKNDINISTYHLTVLNYIKMFDLESAKEALKQCKIIDKRNKKNKELYELIEQEENKNKENIKKYKNYPSYLNFMRNLYKLGLYLNKMEINFVSESYRLCTATEDINKDDYLLRIPLDALITLDDARMSKMGIYFTPNLLNKLYSPKFSLLSSIILTEMDKGNQSKWKFYIDFLPSDYSNFPTFYGEKEYEYLKGTIFLQLIEKKKKRMKKDYDTLTKEIPEFSKYDFDLFKKIREVIASRVFDINIKGKINKAFVPYADLLNHRNNPQTSWNFDDNINSFIIKGVADIKKGEEIFDSYGRKPNHLLLLNYGFTIINNSANEIIVDLVLNKNYPYFKEKITYKKINNNYKKLNLDVSSKITKEFFSFLRFFLYNKPDFKQINTNKPISIQNEKDLFNQLKEIMTFYLNKYPTTLDYDIEYFNKNNRTMEFNEYNCYIIRIGEKEILYYYLNMAKYILELLNYRKNDIILFKNYIKSSSSKSYNFKNKVLAEQLLKYKNYLINLFPLLN